MSSNEANDLRSLSSSSSSCSEPPNSRCTEASAQFRHQMQGGINSGNQGHRQTPLTAQSNQHTDKIVYDSKASSSSDQFNVSISPDARQPDIEISQRPPYVNFSTLQNHVSSFPTSLSCNALIASNSSNYGGSSTAPSSSWSSSASCSLGSLVLQKKQQLTHPQCAGSSAGNHSQSIVPSSVRSSVHSSTPSVSLNHLSQVLHQPSFQSFSSSPSLVQSTCCIGAVNSANTCQFASSNVSDSHPATSSSETVVTTISSASENAGASAHRTQVKGEVTTSSIINTVNSSVDVSTMSEQSNGSGSCISSVNGGRNIASVDCAITKNHSDSTQRNAVHQSAQPSHEEECIDSRAIASSSSSSSFKSKQAHDKSYSSTAGTLHSSEVPAESNAHTINSKQSCKWSKGSHGGTSDLSSADISNGTVKDSTAGGVTSLSTTGTPQEVPIMAPSDAGQVKVSKSSTCTSGTATTAAVATTATNNSCASHTNKTPTITNMRPSSTPDDSLEYCWQSRMPCIIQRLRAILNKETLADVYFLVGQPGRTVKFPAHKFVLSIGSPVFGAMFNGNFKCDQVDPIELPDCEPCAFLALLTFLYTDEVDVDAYSVMSTLYISKKYGVCELEKQCVEFLRRNLAPNNSIVLLSQARFFDETDLAQNCLEYIDKSTVESLNSEGFTEIDRDTLGAILQRDSLEIPELTLWKCVLAWARAECHRKDLDSSNPKIIRAVLGPVLNLMRFPLMSIEEFASEVAQTGVLDDKQIIDMFYYFTLNPKPQLPFSCETRGQKSAKERVVQRFQKVESRWGYSGTSDRIKFQVNRRIFLVGFGLFGAIHGSSEYDVCMQLLLPSGEVLASNETCFTCDGSTQTFRVNFKQPVEIHPNVSHTACVTMKGVDSYYGAQGKSTVSIEVENKSRVTFTFNYSSGCNNGTSVEDGQIPELHFHT